MTTGRITHSPYLTQLLDQFPGVNPNHKVRSVDLQQQITVLTQRSHSILDDTDLIYLELRQAKGHFALLWSIAELNQHIPFTELGRLQSEFADATIQLALATAWASKTFNKLIDTRTISGVAPGVFILGLGKLGGFDLNFSSDVDLIAFYDKSHFPKPRMHAATYVITRLLHLITHLLADPKGGFVWRVDWRLRPYASTHDLTMPITTAMDFYHYHARPWHRLAMIKARVVAGDKNVGEHFLEDLRSFLWRHDLDYRSIDEIAELKDKINREHPELRGQREQHNAPLEQQGNFNLKLGYGGIREIEFIVNALQLVWGGRKPQLRVTNTLSALVCLVRIGLVNTEVGSKLAAAYIFLRQAENRLQMIHNDQAYRTPIDPSAQINYIALLGLQDWANFETECYLHRKLVFKEFNTLFSDKASTQQSKLECELTQLNATGEQILEGWRDGFRDYGVLPEQALELKALWHHLCTLIQVSGIDSSNAVMKLDAFFTRLPPGGQYFKLLQIHPALADKWLRPLLLSESMTVLINQTPHLIDRFLEFNAGSLKQEEQALDSNIVLFTSDYETRLENLRRLTNEELYFRYLQYLDLTLTPRQFEQSLTHLAENLLALCVQVACDEMKLTTPPIAIIGFGKLGMQAMMPQSDLDLVYLFDQHDQLQLANQFAARLQTIINVKMKQGRVYELDTRLRPSGQSGSVTISLNSFEQHQFKVAKTWSHLALFPARFVAGNIDIGTKFSAIRKTTLMRRRNMGSFLLDARSMFERIRQQRIKEASSQQFTVKLLPGGLMELEYLISCLALKYAPDHEDILTMSFDEVVDRLSQLTQSELSKALYFLRSYQLEIRLFGQEDRLFEELTTPIQQHVAIVLGVAMESISEAVDAQLEVVTQAVSEFYADLEWSELKEWKEHGVIWDSNNQN